MSTNNEIIHNRKLEDLSDYGTNPPKDYIVNNSKDELINRQKESVNYPKNINNEDNIKNVIMNTNTLESKNTENNLEFIYEQLIQANDAIQFLNKENFNLKQTIENKDSIIAEYEETCSKTAEKLLNLQKINENLKNEINILKQNNNNYNNNNYNYEKDKEIFENNQYLLESINDIKNNLYVIEDNFNQKIIEKENIINQLNYDLQINNDYKDQINNIINQLCCENNILKTQISCLIKEKEVLLKEKEKEHNEIIKLNEMLNNDGYIRNSNVNHDLKKEIEEKENNYIELLKNQEKEYVLQISKLHRAIVEREKEIDELKQKYQNIIMKLNLDIETLKNKLNSMENLPVKNNINLLYDDYKK